MRPKNTPRVVPDVSEGCVACCFIALCTASNGEQQLLNNEPRATSQHQRPPLLLLAWLLAFVGISLISQLLPAARSCPAAQSRRAWA
jgi:hypothetical protein